MGTDAAFATLGLAVGARSTEITRAFRVQSRASHPDHGGERERFERVLAAYRHLQQCGLVSRQIDAVPAHAFAAAASGEPGSIISARTDFLRTQTVGRPCPVAASYRRFIRDLEAAAAIVVTRPTLAPANAHASPARAPDGATTATTAQATAGGATFAEILDRELLRAAA